jgi:hypothetical protein
VLSDVALFTLAGITAVYLSMIVLDQPFASGRIAFLVGIWLLGALVVHRLVAVGQRRITRKLWRRVTGAFKWCLAIVLSGLVVGLVEADVLKRQVQIARAQLQPVRTQIERRRAETGNFPASLLLFLPADSALFHVEYMISGAHFRVKTQAPTIDIDGRTIGFDSATDRWWNRHNDLASDLPDRRFEFREVCVHRDRLWTCKRDD